MAMKNRYSKSSKLSEARIRAVVKCFAADLTALQTARICALNRNTVNRIYRGLRERILTTCEAQRPLFGAVEVDESFFGAKRTKGRRGRGAYGKTVVFGIFERDGQVYTEIVPDCSKPTLQGIIRGRVDHSKDEFARETVHINGIEGFWGMAKVRLAKFKGLPKHTFHLHLKETEWRFNNRRANTVRTLLKYLRQKTPLLGMTDCKILQHWIDKTILYAYSAN